VETLRRHTVPKQGYTLNSRAVQFLFEILAELSPAEQRLFVRFVTGSPRLPAGELRSLHPPLSIVRVPVFAGGAYEGPAGEELLPSVMTCTSSLKLPDYSTKAVMRAKLLVSILNCSTGFQMS